MVYPRYCYVFIVCLYSHPSVTCSMSRHIHTNADKSENDTSCACLHIVLLKVVCSHCKAKLTQKIKPLNLFLLHSKRVKIMIRMLHENSADLIKSNLCLHSHFTVLRYVSDIIMIVWSATLKWYMEVKGSWFLYVVLQLPNYIGEEAIHQPFSLCPKVNVKLTSKKQPLQHFSRMTFSRLVSLSWICFARNGITQKTLKGSPSSTLCRWNWLTSLVFAFPFIWVVLPVWSEAQQVASRKQLLLIFLYKHVCYGSTLIGYHITPLVSSEPFETVLWAFSISL